ncbi:unnamed protein product [Ostreobium quekettii]|uniref:Uncharacterized protein n=1 Tax=Ostreobium quekettii TaxID=121088 RepID=A0A8S1J6J6_9CHLO|nr:unnamed protein product [Ostreobium quekettii]|eukprot:evm.model.scf_1173.5 EVM.evm.TU.scf_1173.5   scf_1173:22933-27167(-)
MSVQLEGQGDDSAASGAAAQGSAEVEQQAELRASTRDGWGRNAAFGSAAAECRRIADLKYNYYAILKVARDTPHTEVRHNWSRLRKIVAADDAAHLPLAKPASALCDAAFAVLKDPVRKALYDQCACRTAALEGTAIEDRDRSPENSDQAVPKLVHRVLNCPGGALVTCCIFVPGLVISILVTGLMWILVMPFRLAWRCTRGCLGLLDTNRVGRKKGMEGEGRRKGQEGGCLRAPRLDISVVGVAHGDERGRMLKRTDGIWSRIGEVEAHANGEPG